MGAGGATSTGDLFHLALTNSLYASNTAASGKVVQDFGLCNTQGEFVYTAKLRAKGFLVVVFYSPASPPSVSALETVQGWTEGIPGAKWAAVGVSEGDRDTLVALQQQHGLTGLTLLVDHELYQTRRWGVSHLPSVYVVQGKTGRVLAKVIGNDVGDLDAARTLLSAAVDAMTAAETAAKAAEDEKKLADAAAKAAAEAAKPTEPNPAAAAKV